MAKRSNPAPSIADVELDEGLRIDEHALDEALIQQPDLFYRVAKALALEISRRDGVKQDLATLEAKVDAKVRHDAQVADEKITEREVESQKKLHPEVQEVSEELLRLNASVGKLSALKEAYQQRAYALKDLVALYVANYFGSDVDRPSSDKVRTRHAQTAREGMARERQREREREQR